MLIIQLIYFF